MRHVHRGHVTRMLTKLASYLHNSNTPVQSFQNKSCATSFRNFSMCVKKNSVNYHLVIFPLYEYIFCCFLSDGSSILLNSEHSAFGHPKSMSGPDIMGWDWVSWYCGHYWPIVPAPDDRWWWLWRNWLNEDWQGKPKYSEKTCPSATLSTTDPTWLDLGLNPGRRGGKPATNGLSYGAAWMQEYCDL
jgi:hypothetical protein